MTTIDRFTCEQTFQRIDDWVDRELSEREMELARTHLETCAVCAREYSFHASMLQNLKQKLRRIDVSPDLLLRIQAELELARAEERAHGAPPEDTTPH